MKFRINEDQTKLILTESESEEYKQLRRLLNPFVKNYRFMPRYKMGLWDGKIDFFNNGYLNLGLWHFISNICQEYGYKFIIENKELIPKDEIKKENVQEFCEHFYKDRRLKDKKDNNGKIIEKGDKFFPYDHQIEAIYRFLKYRYGLVEIATAGGKSLVISTLVFYILKNINPNAKFLIIVPSISLVTQFYDGLLDYNYGFNNENDNPFNLSIAEIMSEKPRYPRDDSEPNIYIGTYQSLEKFSKSFFKKFDFVATDESHKAKAQSIKKILEKTFQTARYRIGVTGTIPNLESAEGLTIQSLMGPNLFSIKTKKLQDKGLISNLKINALILNYNDIDFAKSISSLKKKSGMGKRAFELEREYIHNSEKRKYFILRLVKSFKSNALILFHSLEYGTDLYNFFRDNISGLNFYYIDGNVKKEKREYIKEQLDDISGNPKVGVCSYGTFSTGIDINAISNIVFADSFKSDQLIRQSIGRGLRLHKDKDYLVVYDIVDRFHKSYTNTLLQHYKTRRNQTYKPQSFPYKEYKIRL